MSKELCAKIGRAWAGGDPGGLSLQAVGIGESQLS